MDPSLVPAVVVAALVILGGLGVLVLLAMERGDPAETAVAYEQAWDRLDFDALWALSGPSLRESRPRKDWVADKRLAYADRTDLTRLVERVTTDRVDVAGRRARVVTRLHLRDGGAFCNEVRMRRHAWRWVVDEYRVGPAAEQREPSAGAS